MKLLLAFITLFSITALAADITGTWKATAEGPNGQMERTFVFKQDGNKLTGETTSSMLGKSVIENGKIDGDNFTFTIKVNFQDNEMKLDYKGTVKGDTIKMTVEIQALGQTIEWTAKKVQ